MKITGVKAAFWNRSSYCGREAQAFSRDGQEFGGWGTWFDASLVFLSPTRVFLLTYLLPSHQNKGQLEFFCVWVCGDGLAFSGSAYGIVLPGEFFRAGDMVARIPGGFRFRFILARVGPHRSINTA